MIVPMSVLEFRDRAARFFGSKVGVVDGEKRFTYAEFAGRTHRLASALRALGLQPGDRVSFITYNTHQLLEAYYGVLEAGLVLNPINIRLTPDEIAYILEHSGSRAVFFHNDFKPIVEKIAPTLPYAPHFVVMEGPAVGIAEHEYEALLTTASPDEPPTPGDENDVVELFYTSGTTGRPKGVALTMRNLYMHALECAIGLRATDGDVVLHVVPLFHVNGWGTPHWVTMLGGRHVMLRKFDPVALMTAVERERVTVLLGVPTIFNAVLNSPDFGKFDLSSLRLLMLGGAPSSPSLIRALEERFGTTAMVGYGLSETTPVLTMAWPRTHLLEAEPSDKRLERQATTGWALPGVQIRVVDWEGRDVAPDERQMGEIVVQSNVVMDGYYRDPDATADRIRDGWFHTGDMATVDAEGYVTIKDRSKDIIISGGENISSVEIENALYAHPAVFECAVVAAPDEKWGEVPVAVVSLKPDASCTAEDLIAHCHGCLAGFKVPRRIEFRDALPKTGTGKLLKSALREPFWAGQEKRVH